MHDESLWLIRHAESTWNAAGRWQGQADPPLSERGRQQAQRLAESLRGEGLEILLTSDLERSAETARIVGRALGVSPRFDARLRELDAGVWSGLSRAEIGRRHTADLERFDAGQLDARAGGGESRRDVARRAREALREIVMPMAASRLAIVSHEGVIESLIPGLHLGHAEWRVVDRGALGLAVDAA